MAYTAGKPMEWRSQKDQKKLACITHFPPCPKISLGPKIIQNDPPSLKMSQITIFIDQQYLVTLKTEVEPSDMSTLLLIMQ